MKKQRPALNRQHSPVHQLCYETICGLDGEEIRTELPNWAAAMQLAARWNSYRAQRAKQNPQDPIIEKAKNWHWKLREKDTGATSQRRTQKDTHAACPITCVFTKKLDESQAQKDLIEQIMAQLPHLQQKAQQSEALLSEAHKLIQAGRPSAKPTAKPTAPDILAELLRKMQNAPQESEADDADEDDDFFAEILDP
ncbi:MAG: hypothetical protein HC888_07395 [Candidatus Competibacteraceae bacterium]|nr:hypothetical protein [Candidatus Competibacteraceae bacterium]